MKNKWGCDYIYQYFVILQNIDDQLKIHDDCSDVNQVQNVVYWVVTEKYFVKNLKSEFFQIFY